MPLEIYCSISYLLNLIQNNIGITLMCLILYSFFGFFWSIYKWYLFIEQKTKIRNKSLDYFFDPKRNWNTGENSLLPYDHPSNRMLLIRAKCENDLEHSDLPIKLTKKFIEYKNQNEKDFEKPIAKKHAKMFLNWFAFWPFYFVSFLFIWLFVDLIFICTGFSKELQKICDDLWENLGDLD
jgi:hypothetical protein